MPTKYLKYFALCLVFVFCIIGMEFLRVSGVHQNLPKFFQSFRIMVNRTQSVQSTVVPTSTEPSPQELSFRKTHFMTFSGIGRLGNQMFEVAALIGTAIRHNYTPFISTGHRINNVFDIKYAQNIEMTNNAVMDEDRAGAYTSRVENLSHDKNWTLRGYFQSWKYFNHCRNEIVSVFNFKPNIKRIAVEVLKTINAKGRPLVGVHVRRTDMATSREHHRGYNVATPEYVAKALSYFRNHTSSPLFVIVSDDRSWSTAHANGPDVVYAGTGNPETDLAILSLCNHSIITSGTFGWWGAYLSGGKTVYFSNFPGRGSWLSTLYDPADYYLPDWIGME